MTHTTHRKIHLFLLSALATLALLMAVPAPAPDDAELATAVRTEIVRATGGADTLPIADEVLARAVAEHLMAELVPAPQGLAITVRDGVVSLGGELADAAQGQRAAELAAQVEGVRWVENRLGDTDAPSVRRLATPGNTPVHFLTPDGRSAGRDVRVHVQDRVATLTGIVDSRRTADLVYNAAQRVPGLATVRSALDVMRPAPAADGTRGAIDEVESGLAFIVRRRLDVWEGQQRRLERLRFGEPLVRRFAQPVGIPGRFDDVRIRVDAGIARLEGAVDSEEIRVVVQEVAGSTTGILAVDDRLRVRAR